MASESPDSSRFFVLQKGVLRSRYDTDVEELEPVHHGEGANCTRCGGPVGFLPWLPPYRVDLEVHGEEPGDFIKPVGYELIVSERFMRAFRAEGLIGLDDFQPVEVRRVRSMRKGKNASTPFHYFVTRAPLSHTAVDLSRSRIVYSVPPTCDECRYGTKDAVHGFTLEAGTWQGEDIFRPRGLQGTLVVSERFERFVSQHGFTNMRLTPTEKYVWDSLGRVPDSPVG